MEREMTPHPYIKSVTFTPAEPVKYAGRTREEWVRLAASATHGMTPDQHRLIAEECIATTKRGEHPAIWHAASVVCGTLDRCQCHPCIAARKASP